MKTEQEIKNNVFMENEMRIICNKYEPLFKKALRPHIGQVIRLKSGEMSKKIKDLLPEIDQKQPIPPLKKGDYARMHYCHLQISEYSVILRVSICFNGGSYDTKPSTAYCQYVEKSCYIADIENYSTIKSIYPEADWDLIDENQQVNDRKKAEELLAELETVNSRLMPENQVKYR